MSQMLLIKYLFRDINMRQIVYFMYPILYGMTVFSLFSGSWLFFTIASVCFFFSMDCVLVQVKDRILDISKFYAIPKPLNRLLLDYFLYRLKISFLFSFLPSFLIGIVLLSWLQPPSAVMSQGEEWYFYYGLSVAISWIFYMLVSTPLLVGSFRSKAIVEVYKAPSNLFYLSFLISQFIFMNIALPVQFSIIIALYIIILLVILATGYNLLFKLLRKELMFPQH